MKKDKQNCFLGEMTLAAASKHSLSPFCLQTLVCGYVVGTVIFLILQIVKLQHKEVKAFVM